MQPRDNCLTAIIKWAENADNVQALIQTGSLARKDNSSDDLSDIDIEIITSDPALLMKDEQWMHQFGELITVLSLDPDEHQKWATRLAIYNSGVKVDFTLTGIDRVRHMADSGMLDDLYERGYRILLDKTSITQGIPASTYGFPVRQLPSQNEFKISVEEFWFEAFHIPKYLARGELWLVKFRDNTMKELLMCMLEWHALARNNKPTDLWHNGLHVREWVDSQTWAELQNTFGRFDTSDALRAFEATTQLYGRLGREVAQYAGFDYPQECETRITELNRKILSQHLT
ncbi:aminoglycoside 6-adenylyltransferase [Xenorhabdus anantnagensis]|uniref:Aminoglycoside 6-adenylyltransferase n=1 Tax=Xenorhabdus anantnagensis TaxID=3025875 RepID=A0ABT5LQE4_9GAMM|nr:aminoglycoside 6-adenylyltransferase [Xenorhabdus anantnagensis]MDC9596642.1 aminoglycoside 6-adenylyltransferase [Xenorhabdus anantnagensis]